MNDTKRATVYFEANIHKALRLKAAELDQSLSELVNEILRQSLLEDAIDLEALDKRKKQPVRSFESFVKELRKDGHL